jgi:hypothetical protein
MVARARRVFTVYVPKKPIKQRPHDAEKLADNMAFCRRRCCRNPRRCGKGQDSLTWQELRARSAHMMTRDMH